MLFTIKNEICTFCGLCADDCPSKVIKIDRSSKTAVIKNEGCIKCSHCGMICPAGAVRVDGKELTPYPKNSGGAAELFDHLILSKRSIRKYNNKLPGSTDLEAILLAGQLTATASNSRQVDSIIIQSPEVQKTAASIARIIQNVLRLVRNPIGRNILKLAGYKRYADKALLGNFHNRMSNVIDGKSDVLFFNAPVVVILTYSKKGKMFGRTDCALAGQNMMLTAHNRGIGSCMIGFAEAALWNNRLRKKVGVAPDRRIGLIFTLGYTDRKHLRYPTRSKWEI
ncbi:MAG: nitroreductase family protein [Spirochaetales bacterium]|nr:nitroreductase family protein [Spirochaetales bacterium]